MAVRDAKGRFIAGEGSANPGGRPKSDLSITALIDSAVTENDWLFIIGALLKRARRGDVKAIEMLMDRRFGKPLQANTLSNPDGSRFELVIVEREKAN